MSCFNLLPLRFICNTFIYIISIFVYLPYSPRGPSESDDMYSGWVDVAEEAEASETEGKFVILVIIHMYVFYLIVVWR